MDAQLRKDRESRSEIVKQTIALAEKYLAAQDVIPPGIYVGDITHDTLPEEGTGALGALKHFDNNYAHLLSNSAGPRYFGFVTGGSTPASLAGDWLVSAYDQNACGSHDSVAPQLEHQTINYFRQLFALESDYYGSFVTGATMSNFTGLALARQWIGEQHGIDASSQGFGAFPCKVVSATPHSSIIKSLAMLGMGRQVLHKIETLPDREAIDIAALENFLADYAKPVIVVASAGTVNTGDFDDLSAMGALKKKYKFWMHVDAAFGGFAACSNKYRHLMTGINDSDSITIDAHKWLNVPYDAAMQFTRHQSLQLKVFQNSGAYLGDPQTSPDFFHYTPENSRRWRALPSWFSLRAYGKKGYSEIVERNCALARQLGERIAKSDAFSLLSPVRLNIVCFTINHPAINAAIVQDFLKLVRDDGRVFFTPTVYKGRAAVRAAVSNWQTESRDMEIAFEVIANVWNKLKPSVERQTANIKAF